MKRLFLLALIAGFSAFGQDALTVETAGGQLSKIDWTWTSDGSGNASGVSTTVVPGVLYSISTTPSASVAPTDNYDIVVQNQVTGTDGSAVVLATDRAGGLVANRDNVNTELVEFWPDGVYTTQGKIKISVSNAGASKSGRIVITFHRNLSVTGFSGGVTSPLGSVLGRIMQWSTPGVPKWVTVSGDAALADGGALTIANGAVTPAKTSITGTPNGLKYLRDDWTWQVPGGGGGVGNVSGPGLSTDNALALWDGTDGDTLQNSDITYSGTAITVPADVLITGNNGLALAGASPTLEWYNPTISASNLRWRFTTDGVGEASTWTGTGLQIIAYDNTGTPNTLATLYRDPTVATSWERPFTVNGGLLTTKASATGGAGFNLPPGTAPTSPNNGDVWTTSLGLYARINGATVGPYVDAAGSGVTDHGALTGLADDDHTQYLNTTRHAAIDAADHTSGAATDDYVLTADGAGGAAWEAVPLKALASNVTEVGNVGTGEDNLMTYTVPAGRLADNGDTLEILAYFALLQDQEINLKGYLGTSVFFNETGVSGSTGPTHAYIIKATISRTGATSQMWFSRREYSANDYQHGTMAETLSGALTLKFTGQSTGSPNPAADNDVVQKWMLVRAIDAP